MNFILGGSGCVLEDRGKGVIRKVSSSKQYNSRLVSQRDKQLAFCQNFECGTITVPDVISSGYVDDKFYFDMEYVTGQLFFDYVPLMSYGSVDRICTLFGNYFGSLAVSSHSYNYMELVSTLCYKLDQLEPTSKYSNFVRFLRNEAITIDRENIPYSFCHGDLTFSNMIFSKNGICLIDFLDSYVNSFVIDLIKLKQDLYHHWSFVLGEVPDYCVLRIKQVFAYVWNSLLQRYGHIIDTYEFRFLEALNFLRIEPYLSGDRLLSLYNIIESLDLYEKFDSTHSRRI